MERPHHKRRELRDRREREPCLASPPLLSSAVNPYSATSPLFPDPFVSHTRNIYTQISFRFVSFSFCVVHTNNNTCRITDPSSLSPSEKQVSLFLLPNFVVLHISWDKLSFAVKFLKTQDTQNKKNNKKKTWNLSLIPLFLYHRKRT